jgi:hypothetical protein
MTDVTNPFPGLYAGEGEMLSPDAATLWAVRDADESVIRGAFVSEMAVFLYAIKENNQRVVMGTGFIAREAVPGVPGADWYYLVTARHVIEGIRKITGDHKVHIRANSLSTGSDMWDETPLDAFIFHPRDSDKQGDEWLEWSSERRYDVAVTPVPGKLLEDGAVTTWAAGDLMTNERVRKNNVGQGDDLAIIGLYHRQPGRTRITPIVRAAMIAAMPTDDLVSAQIGPINGYLVEARSTGGLSGSPVVWFSRPEHIMLGTSERPSVVSGQRSGILGMVAAHFDAPAHRNDEWINEGIAVVTTSADILETLRQESIMSERAKKEPEVRKLSPYLARMDSLSSEHDDGRVSLEGVAPADALRALLKTPPHGQTEDPA